MNLDGFSMRPLTAELKNLLVGGRIDKITQHNKVNFTFTIRQPGETYKLKISVAPQSPAIYVAKNSLENLPEPPTFCMVLRKNLENGRVVDIRQHELDRIIFIDVDTIGAGGKIITVTLSVELIGKYSNIILVCDEKIIDALKKIGTNSSRVRTVLPNQIYQLPPTQNKLDIFSENISEIIEKIKSDSTARIDKAVMNVCQGFGPQTIKQVIFAANLSCDAKIDSLDENNFVNLKNSLEKIRDAAKNPAPCLVEDAGKILAVSAVTLNYFSQGQVKIFETISEMLEVADEIAGSYTPPDKEKFLKLVKNEFRRATNKISVLENELAAAENADDWRIFADNLSTYRYQFQDHADDFITVQNIYSEIGEEIKIPLDKKITINANVQTFYKKYDKLKRSAHHILEQIDKCRAEILYLESVEHSLASSETLAEIDEIRAELMNGGYLKEIRKKTASSKKSEPFKFFAPDGTEILIGKNNSQNDRLTFKIAEPNDIWLHTKEITGSHVIIRCNGIFPSDETLLYAARLAVKFSKAAGSSKVPVDYTLCKFVKKPSGAKPGFVIFTNQKTVYVNDD
ncbi:MAG: NFACT family protein [Selenomonadaceae bacterium]|nr:NFACT family protein [Selenomonadaceae bacterium]